jgi:hypothetical protein
MPDIEQEDARFQALLEKALTRPRESLKATLDRINGQQRKVDVLLMSKRGWEDIVKKESEE